MTKDNYFRRKDIKVTSQPNIGLDSLSRQSVVEILNLLLADEAVLSFKTHSADGHKGHPGKDNIQAIYEVQYQDLQEIAQEIAERVQILGGIPLSSSEELLDTARLDGELTDVPDLLNLLADHEAFLRFLREDSQKCYDMYEDQGTFAMLITVLRRHEKMTWSLRSNIDPMLLGEES